MLSILLTIFSLFIPTQLALHINSPQSTVFGFKIDYLIPTIYLTDILAILIIFLGIKYIKINRRFVLYAIGYIVFASINILVSNYLVPSAYRWLKVTELITLGLIIINYKNFNVFTNFVKPLSYSIFAACFLGVLQFINKGSIGGIFYWLGERSFSFSDPNIASYPYSIFSHPNSFAGFLLVFGIFLLKYKNKFDQKYFWSIFFLISINLILTNSLNVYLAIAVLLLLSVPKTINFIFLTLNFSDRYISHRVELIISSLKMIKENFWTGVGLNNFIPNLVKVNNSYLNAWELQPVHNIFLLVFSETGIVGLCALFLVLYGSFSVYNLPLLAIIITGLSDHYWLTLQQNMILLTVVLAISYRNKKWKIKKQ